MIYFSKVKFILFCIFLLLLASVVSIRCEEYKTTPCNQLKTSLLNCKYNINCTYGEPTQTECAIEYDNLECQGDRHFTITHNCLYCWQTPEEHHICVRNTTCKLHTRYIASCSVDKKLHCLGNRDFLKYKNCNVISWHKRSVAITLSYLLGGFGADRFYLGHWQEGIGKLFSFGGFGVWTLIDAILVTIGYLKPAALSE